MTVRRPRALLFALCGPLLMLAHAASPKVERIVILKVDGLPQRLIEQYTRPSGRPERVRLPHIATIFGEHGASLDHFYSRGLSLSAPSWSLLDTGRHLEIHGNVEYDRYTLRPWDYLNFFPFYVGYALSRRVDMPGAEFLDQQGVPLLIDRFPYQQRYQSFQLLQRGIRWSTLHSSLQVGFVSRSLRDLFDEWQTGFSMSDSVNQATERDILRDLKNPQIRYLDYFTGEFDHVAHLTPDRAAQLHVLESLDALTGRLWSAIQSSPLAATTALVMVSDHGMNTDEQVYSQGYNLVDWFNSAAGGGHHVITDRHPMTEFKLKGLDPFVSEVITPSREATYLAGKSAEYPTVILDLDGNERANVALRDNALNIAQILLDQITQKKASGRMRGAAISALLELIDSKRAFWEARLAEMETERIALRQRIDEQQRLADKSPKRWTKAQRDKGLDKDARRIEDRIERNRQQERGNAEYIAAMRRLLSLTDADFDPGKFKSEEVIPRKSLGELNSIHDLQNYVVGLQPGGLVLSAIGSIDHEKSFRTIDYLTALTSLSVRNNVQKEVSPRPVDFIAMRIAANYLQTALADHALGDGIWLYSGADRQALILTRRTASGQTELRYLPIANLTQDSAGAIHFDRCDWSEGFPLAIVEDPSVDMTRDVLAQWHDERTWFAALHRSRYSNGLIGLTEQLLDPPGPPSYRRDRLRTDLLVFAKDHWNFNVRGFNPGGNHGSMLRPSTHSVLMIAGGRDTGLPKGLRIQAPYDSLSFVPTILSLMGRPEADLPGPVIEELLPE